MTTGIWNPYHDNSGGGVLDIWIHLSSLLGCEISLIKVGCGYISCITGTCVITYKSNNYLKRCECIMKVISFKRIGLSKIVVL